MMVFKATDVFQDQSLFIRADASHSIGEGHVMRCFAIAQSWMERGGKVTFVCKYLPLELEDRLNKEGFRVSFINPNSIGDTDDAFQTGALAKANGCRCLILDGYHFMSIYQEILKNQGLKIVVVDDYGYADFYWSDLILNKSLIAHTLSYSNKSDNTKLLLGPKYNILRKEFLSYKNKEHVLNTNVNEILVTFGGSDPDNVSSKILQYLDGSIQKQIKVKVVIGSGYRYMSELKEQKKRVNYNLEIVRNARNMAEIMYRSDVAISAGGTTLFELAYMGVPCLVVQIAANQKSAEIFGSTYGACIYAGDVKNIGKVFFLEKLKEVFDMKRRKSMSNNGKLVVDGKGNERLMDEMANLLRDEI
ncbi:UDP-2,4-diacetamido-2,4,6-trideoxy-beta-L-altropyranose hydrolase [Halobacillus sp. Nhm2S1]|uniref:UDP-2,4-diacetamido-2,4, 6-trideoxy-beta-L-altropyranose hydrolase n=1 Tax=Halobacillus sp. Nhm2S1 TaxID=2866716 RepID=UPI001C72ED3D|nr:UDP-2,4-diacetamido-2,4,6-trideoxy-beta-L-altropyranose hydrolase [Halobacillus sp. Nhm2S1]MBX0359453.1 UDP-2,4-diacetamido-2,4,6-trideoxy-beta-L-altropyranose hydrolase [Halobacillus sp. Nhm2S1]